MAAREGRARWSGDLMTGSGDLTVGQGNWTSSYAAGPRFHGVLPGFDDEPGTNPEELLATAHAACFSMALALSLSGAGHPPRSIETTARVHLRNTDGMPTIEQIDLETTADAPGLEEQALAEHAMGAKTTCIISRALAGVGQINVAVTSAAG
ncbi:MAG TPA: OsmC family peroxiredoxin [Pseudonocardiaceae bacterium]|jgi:lipoyl-dependent peroxiredoxin